MAFSILLQVVLLGIGNTLLSFVIPSYFSIIFLGTSNRRMFDSVLVFFLRVIIQRLSSKNIYKLSAVKFFTSEYASPVNTEKRNKSLTSSWVLSGISVFIRVCISSFVIYHFRES